MYKIDDHIGYCNSYKRYYITNLMGYLGDNTPPLKPSAFVYVSNHDLTPRQIKNSTINTEYNIMSLAHIHFNKIQSILETIAKHQDFVDNFVPYADETDEMNERIVNVDKT